MNQSRCRFLVGRERDPTASDIYRLLAPTLDPDTRARLQALSNAAALALAASSPSPLPLPPSPTPPQTPAAPSVHSDGAEASEEAPLEPPPSDLVNVRELPSAAPVETIVLPPSSISDRSSLQSADECRELPLPTTVADAESDEIWRRLRSDRSTQSSPTPAVELERALALVRTCTRTSPPSRSILRTNFVCLLFLF